MNNHDFVVSLDIGTSKVRVIIGELNNSSINIIGVGSTESEGIKKGAIVDIDLTVQSIRRAVESAERMVGVSIDQVFVGITGNHIHLQPSQGVVAVSSEDREIGEEDIIRVIEASKVVAIPPEREIIDVVPQQFIVDGLDSISDPRGMIGVRLEMEGTIITGSKTVIHNLVRCIERAGLTIAGIFLQPLAASSIALTKDEKSIGTVLVDVGAGQTTVSIFEQGSLAATSLIPIGGEYITNDIAIGLRTTTEMAEKIKLKHGCAFIDDAIEEEVFKVPKIGSHTEQQINQLDLAHIIEPRVAEIFELVHREVRRMGYTEVPGGYVLSGGVVGMQGVQELAKYVLHHPVRVAVPDYIGVREPQFTTSVGIIKYAYQQIRRQQKEVAATSAPSMKKRVAPDSKSSAPAQKETVKDKFKSWFKEFI